MIPIKGSANFTLLRRNDGQFQINCLEPGCVPRIVRISEADADYLRTLNGDFDGACVLDFGCGVFREDEP